MGWTSRSKSTFAVVFAHSVPLKKQMHTTARMYCLSTNPPGLNSAFFESTTLYLKHIEAHLSRQPLRLRSVPTPARAPHPETSQGESASVRAHRRADHPGQARCAPGRSRPLSRLPGLPSLFV